MLLLELGQAVIGHLARRQRAEQRENTVLAFESFLAEQRARVRSVTEQFEQRRRQREMALAPFRRLDLEMTEDRT